MNKQTLEVFDNIAFSLVLLDDNETTDRSEITKLLTSFKKKTSGYDFFLPSIEKLEEVISADDLNLSIAKNENTILIMLELLRTALNEIQEKKLKTNKDGPTEYSEGLRQRFIKELSTEDIRQEEPEDIEIDEIEQIRETIESEIYQEFSAETNNRLLESQDTILEFDDSFDRDKMHSIYRIFHTIKGECGFINLSKMGDLVHNLENLLDAVLKKHIDYDSDITEVILESIDKIAKLMHLLDSGDIKSYIQYDIERIKKDLQEMVKRKHPLIGEILVEEKIVSPEDIEDAVKTQHKNAFEEPIGEILINKGKTTPKDVQTALEKQSQIGKERHDHDPIINVHASQINLLSDLIQELWIAESQIQDESIHQIQKITSQIQHISMSLRTIKIQNLYIKMRRVVRELDKKLKKNVNVEFIGHELEIDRNLVESLVEAVMHLLRNCYDHGIEDPEARVKAGKPKTGYVEVKAERKGNRIIISIRDDGRGLERDKIIKRAVALELISEKDAAVLSDSKIYEFILMPGFSTSESVSDISGRGIGMDVIKTMITAHQGRLNIDSIPGKYTLFELSFPLNTAIVDGLIVQSSGAHFVIPVAEVEGCTQLEDKRIYRVKDSVDVIEIREEVIPLINLREILFDQKTSAAGKTGEELTRQAAVIVHSEKRKIALQVDTILEKKEVVIKPLGKKFQNLPGISSGTVFSGGKIGYILDVEELIMTQAKDVIKAAENIGQEK